MSRWADAFAALSRSPDTLDTGDALAPAAGPSTHSVKTVKSVTEVRCSNEGTLTAFLEPDDTRDTSNTSVPVVRPTPLSVTNVHCVPSIDRLGEVAELRHPRISRAT
jgi:hypothetical protein